MKFKFKLEAVMKYRKVLLQEAQKEYFEAKSRLDECLAEINQMYEDMDTYRREIVLAQQATTQPKALASMEVYIDGLKIKIERTRQRARELMMVAEDKQDVFIQRAKEFKMIEKLKLRRRHVFDEQSKKREQKQADDMQVMRASKRAREL